MDDFFEREKITDNIFRISGVLQEYMYLILGDSGAILIDTGCGAGNAAEYVKTITDLPLTVLLTHGHFDHMGGAYNFDQVWISPKEADPTPIHYHPEWVREQLNSQGIPVKAEEMTALKPLRFHWLKDGMIFRAGKTEVECLFVPGHTVETCAFHPKKKENL